MKYICLLLMLSASYSNLIAQETTPVVNTDYLKKSKAQRTTGIVLLVTGAVSSTIGLAITLSSLGNFLDPDQNSNSGSSGDVLGYGGLVIMATSIPFLVASSKNRKRAASIGFKLERSPLLLQQSVRYQSYPAASIKISLGKR
jgi:hypothetical protein